MKKWYIKKINEDFEFNNKEFIYKSIDKLGIDRSICILNTDNSVTINGNVNISKKRLKFISIKFDTIYGDFDCSFNMLTTMNNFPKKITGSFNCSNNNIKSFKGGPKYVGNHYDVSFNYLSTFDYNIQSQINGNLNLANNSFINLHNSPKRILNTLNLDNNKLKNINNKPEFIGVSFSYENNPLKKSKKY